MVLISSKSKTLLPFLVGIPSLLVQAQQIQNSCPSNEEPLEFRFFTDSASWLENGWTLECEDAFDGTRETVWDVPPGSLKFSPTTQIIRESTCITDTTSCFLTITDSAGNGLLSTNEENGFTGWFAFLHGATTVATYSNEPDPHFSKLEYCVGPKCEKPAQEAEFNSASQCETAYLALQLDAHPEETSYQLVCDGETVWDGKDFTQAGAYLEEEACIAATSCCTFTVSDDGTQGLTAEHNGNPGFVYLEWYFQGLMEYDGVTGEEFDTKSIQFGLGCNKDWQSNVNLPVEDTDSAASGTNTYSSGGSAKGRPPLPEDFLDLSFGGPSASQGSGLSSAGRIALFTVGGLCIFACLVVGLLYRNSLLRCNGHEKEQPEGYEMEDGDSEDSSVEPC
mmetsp:Transcript_24179/g.42490  ORF Transcript_24179/g.42490 Transcript_24179/m.42490 type:complete len:393 (+) Transcript_24179:95-1273(+)